MRFSPGTSILWLLILFVVMQVVRPARTNPPTDPTASLRATKLANAAAVAVMERSCRDCHSNDTTWPWYSGVAPMSWLVVHDVNDGRGEFNMSEFGTYDPPKQQRKLQEACEQVKKGEMPKWVYLIRHRDATLQPGDEALICSLSAAGPVSSAPQR
jgi:DNA replicative helicase MCM subunit Mcm2 (Cdc46/Mcm family)